MFSLDKRIDAAVENAIDRRTVRPDKKLTLEGYHPLPEIMGTLFEWLLIPFRGAEILVEVRYPRSTQLPNVDKLYNIINEEKEEKKLSRQDVIDILNIQEECCKAILNRPTFDEIEKAIHGKDKIREKNVKTLEELKAKLDGVKNDQEKYALKKEIEMNELCIGYSLPDDTMLALTNIALGIGVSDIKKITKEKLVTAYFKARMYNSKPSDFIPGLFTDGDRENVDDYATILGNEEEVNRIKKRGKQ